jgi:hypothetical protein
MPQLLDGILPQATPEYSRVTFDQLVKRLQQILGTRVESEDHAEEMEAVQFFLD